MNVETKKLRKSEDRKRKDIKRRKLYLVQYEGTWLLGRFSMQWYGWIFNPNMGSHHMQIEWLDAIYEVLNLKQKKDGSTAAFIGEYLTEDNNDD